MSNLQRQQVTSLNAYWNMTRAKNELNNGVFSAHLKKTIKHRMGYSESVLFALTGSDARLEKGIHSDTDLIVIYRNLPLSHVKSVFNLNPKEFDGALRVNMNNIEYKNFLDSQNGAYSDNGRIYPQRVLEAIPLFGSKEILDRSKESLVYEWRDEAYGNKVEEQLNSRAGFFRQIMVTGEKISEGIPVKSFDLGSGISYYFGEKNPEGQCARSFKDGPLQYVQTVLISNVVNFCRNSSEQVALDIVKNLPGPVLDKIDFLLDRKISSLSSSQVSDAKGSYIYFLMHYHESERAYKKDGVEELGFDIQEVKERLNSLVSIFGGKAD